MANNTSSPLIPFAVAGILLMGLYGAWVQGQRLPIVIAELPIQGQTVAKLPEGAPAPAIVEVTKSLHPLLIESSRKTGPVLKGPFSAFKEKELDVLFDRQDIEKKKVSPSENKEVKPAVAAVIPQADYFGQLSTVVKIQALSATGAVINNRFYAVGESIPSLAYPPAKPGKMVVPVLSKVDQNAVYLENPVNNRSLRIPLM
ncbi:MAG: hypothetical protein Q7S87_09720 [Agitococcus sp.]|nr:hypothetical protein [Agitococcus sp.]MDO9179239.1 hypothetical protein [Agitococcus sp.]